MGLIEAKNKLKSAAHGMIAMSAGTIAAGMFPLATGFGADGKAKLLRAACFTSAGVLIASGILGTVVWTRVARAVE